MLLDWSLQHLVIFEINGTTLGPTKLCLSSYLISYRNLLNSSQSAPKGNSIMRRQAMIKHTNKIPE